MRDTRNEFNRRHWSKCAVRPSERTTKNNGRQRMSTMNVDDKTRTTTTTRTKELTNIAHRYIHRWTVMRSNEVAGATNVENETETMITTTTIDEAKLVSSWSCLLFWFAVHRDSFTATNVQRHEIESPSFSNLISNFWRHFLGCSQIVSKNQQTKQQTTYTNGHFSWTKTNENDFVFFLRGILNQRMTTVSDVFCLFLVRLKVHKWTNLKRYALLWKSTEKVVCETCSRR